MKRFLAVMVMTACILMLHTGLLLNHNTAKAEKKKIILRHADTLEGGEDDGGPFRAAIGNVEFIHEGIRLTCRKAIDYEAQGKIVLRGAVYISNGTSEIFSDTGTYYPNSSRCELEGNVRGRMLDGSLSGKAARGTVDDGTDTIILQGDALVWHGHEQLGGERITLHFRESEEPEGKMALDWMVAEGNARYGALDTLSTSTPAYDQLGGRRMEIRIGKDSRIEGIRVQGEAESLYNIYDEQHRLAGIHYASGNSMRMAFRDGTLYRITVKGYAEGAEYPPSFQGRTDIGVRGFVWRGEENPFGPKNGESLR